MKEEEILFESLKNDSEKLSFFTRRFPYYADVLSKLLLGRDTTDATDEELELSYHEITSELFELFTSAGDPFSGAMLASEKALLAAETVKALTERATIKSFLLSLDAQEGKCVYFRNAYSDEAFRAFSPYLLHPTASYTDTPSSACREVYNELATFAILPISSSKEGMIGGIARAVSRYELALTLTADVTLSGKDETMTMGLFAQTPIAIKDAEYLEAVLFCDDPATLTSLLLSADHLDCPVVSLETLTDTESFRCAYRITFTKKEKASLFALWLLLRCEYPHHRLCALWRKIKK